jgi:alkanesulfonate monooxygenase SsuD/methylene tetrahydromethanopterin reductase-like flavin-dependent oxidoreductase (luciferase family)
MRFGLQLNSQRPMAEAMRCRLEEPLAEVRRVHAVRFHSSVAPQYYPPAPSQRLLPLPLSTHMAAAAERMRPPADIILLSLQTPVGLTEDVGTLEAICNSRFTVGVAQVLEAITLFGERVIPQRRDV